MLLLERERFRLGERLSTTGLERMISGWHRQATVLGSSLSAAYAHAARLELLRVALGALGAVRAGDRVVECDRGALVAPYMGQTALKVREAFDRASGGVLFVDEAHALVESDKDAFGREALDTLVKLLEDLSLIHISEPTRPY